MHSNAKSRVSTSLTRVAVEDAGPLVLLIDDFQRSALSLLPTVLRDPSTRNRSYCLVACGRPASDYAACAAQFPGDGARLFVEGHTVAQPPKEHFATAVLEAVQRALHGCAAASVVLIVDSLTSLLPHGADAHEAVALTRRLLATCKAGAHVATLVACVVRPNALVCSAVCCVVLVTHGECHAAAFLDALKYAASAHLVLGPASDKVRSCSAAKGVL